MPYPINANVYEWTQQLTSAGGTGPFYNVFHLGSAIQLTSADVSSVNNAFKAFYTSLAPFLSNATTVTCGFKAIQFTDPPTILAGTQQTVSGTNATGQAAPQNAMCVSWRTDRAGRSYRGRTFIGPLGYNTVGIGGQITTTAANAAAPAGVTLINAIGAIHVGTYLGVYSHKHNLLTPILSVAVSTAVRTQRSRA